MTTNPKTTPTIALSTHTGTGSAAAITARTWVAVGVGGTTPGVAGVGVCTRGVLLARRDIGGAG